MEEEILDIVDDDDNVIGQDTRENLKRKGMDANIRSVDIFVFNSRGQLLLPKRSMNRSAFPGRYDFSAGEHLFSGEGYDDGAVRGLKEELGIEGVKPVFLGKLTPKKDGVHQFLQIYRLVYDGGIQDYDRDGVSGIGWYDIKTIKEMIKDKGKFKPDFPIVFRWYVKNFKG
ncbi:MAG: NUDIX domain-containing protein [archaeon]